MTPNGIDFSFLFSFFPSKMCTEGRTSVLLSQSRDWPRRIKGTDRVMHECFAKYSCSTAVCKQDV